jgi:hypothetical protein
MYGSLRRQALESRKAHESTKTMSRKAKARLEASTVASPGISPAGSRSSSRAARLGSHPNSAHGSVDGSHASPSPPRLFQSSEGSEDEDDEDDEEELIKGLSKLVDTINNRDFAKASSEGRATHLKTLANSLAANYYGDDDRQMAKIIPTLLKCASDGTDAPTTIPAVRSLAIILVTVRNPSGDLYAEVRDHLKACVEDSSSSQGQAAAIGALACAAYFGAASLEEIEEILDYYLEIVATDGKAVDAADNAEVVTAAIQYWSFLSTFLEVDVDKFNDALTTFVDQLDSTSPEVLVAAGQAIALIYEKEYVPNVGDVNDIKDGTVDEDEEMRIKPAFRRSNWAHAHLIHSRDDRALKAKLEDLAKARMRHAKRETQKLLHATFRDIGSAVNMPWRGPAFGFPREEIALGGPRATVGYGPRGGDRVPVERWWQQLRIEAVRALLKSGTREHYLRNPAVGEILAPAAMPRSRFTRRDGDENEVVFDKTGVSEVTKIADQPAYGDVSAEESDEE